MVPYRGIRFRPYPASTSVLRLHIFFAHRVSVKFSSHFFSETINCRLLKFCLQPQLVVPYRGIRFWPSPVSTFIYFFAHRVSVKFSFYSLTDIYFLCNNIRIFLWPKCWRVGYVSALTRFFHFLCCQTLCGISSRVRFLQTWPFLFEAILPRWLWRLIVGLKSIRN